jgi:multidrug efflux pump subunit AcrA (membrane-fusion protein)
VQQSEFGEVVFVASTEGNSQKAQMRKVKTGLSYNGQVEVLEGLKAGESLITSGYQDLVDGQVIKVSSPAANLSSAN